MLVQCNHLLVVLPYLKLPFELRTYFCACTDKPSHTRHSGMLHQPAFIKVSLRADSSSFEDCRASHCGSKNSSSATVCLNHKVVHKYLINAELHLTFLINLLNRFNLLNKSLVVKTLINILKFSLKY